jgi:hypothetical protein
MCSLELFSFNVKGQKWIDRTRLVDAAVVFESDVLPSLETFGLETFSQSLSPSPEIK